MREDSGMAEPVDLLRAWRDVMDELRSLAPSIPGQGQFTDTVVKSLQRQAELLEQALSRQIEFERTLAGQVLEPVRVAFDALEQTSTAMRTQATAMQAAAAALQQAGELLELQASMVERATGALRDPAAALRATVLGRRAGDDPDVPAQ